MQYTQETDYASFYDNLDSCDTLSEQLHLILNTPYDLYLEPQPGAICQRLYITSDKEAELAANAMMKRFGNIIVEREGSFCAGEIWTIIDEFEYMLGDDLLGCPVDLNDGDFISTRMMFMYRAFISLGMKHAFEYDNQVLSYIYGSDPVYKYSDQAIENYCEFEPRTELKYGLIEYLHQPRFIAKWIENGDNELEDYLQ